MKKKKTVIVLVILIVLLMTIILIYNSHYNLFSSIEVVNFSIDDCIYVFKDLNENQDIYTTIFENDTLSYLKNLHEEYGATFTLYCFYICDGFNLSECTDKFSNEFKENSDWLRFGFHAYDSSRDYSVNNILQIRDDYNLVINELIRITNEKNINTVVRLEKFLGSLENMEELSKCEYGITGLLGADTDNRINYYLSDEINKELFENDYYYDSKLNINVYNTDLRIENWEKNDTNIFQDEKIIIFTHEWALDENNRIKINELLKMLYKNNCEYSFLK